METNEMRLTVAQLRQLLFNIDDQEMTIRELRSRLFGVNDQDQPLVSDFMVWKRIGVEGGRNGE